LSPLHGLVVEGPRQIEQQHEGHVATARVWSPAVQQTERCSSRCVLKWKHTPNDYGLI